jgi:filamentous hemagglutinin
MKASRIQSAVALALATSASCACFPAPAATLPVPCAGGACGNTGFVSAGQASAVQAGAKLTVNQASSNVVLNWQSFNISAGGTVKFVQPSATAVALNNIFQSSPSQIFGALNANGRVFLINQNGIIFGSTAQVNVGSLVASTLPLDTGDAISGTASQPQISLLQPGINGRPAFSQSPSGSSGAVSVQPGATLTSADSGQILLFAPQVANQGTISSPEGQTVLAAGTEVYLAASSDPNLRGLLVEVGNAAAPSTTPTVTNGNAADANATSTAALVGQIIAERGNVTLAGLAVNQLGRVSATTSINENGSIRLQAGQGTLASEGATGIPQIVPGAGGAVVLGPHSDTEVTLDMSDPSMTVDSVAQPKSWIDLFGDSIDVLNKSVVRATGGTISAAAARNQNDYSGNVKVSDAVTPQQDGSRIYIAPQAVLDVSGASAVLPVSSNVISAQLRSTELADSPVQQNGPLHGQTVYVDIRDYGTLPDGTPWQGTPLANVSGEIAGIQRNVAERNLTGGSINLLSHGDVIVAPGSMLDVAGGEIQYTPGVVNTTELLTTTGQIVNIGAADPNQTYAGIVNSVTAGDPKWGVSQTYATVPGTYEPGYTEGKDAGTVQLTAPQFVLDGNVDGAVVAGIFQRLPTQPFSVQAGGPLYRPYNQVPAGGTLIIGDPQPTGSPPEFGTGNVTIEPQMVLSGLRNADGTAFDPLNPSDLLPATYSASVLRPDLIGAGGFTNLGIYIDGKLTQSANAALRFPVGGTLTAEASAIDLQGSIDAPGGSIFAEAEATPEPAPGGISLTLGSGAQLTARGAWVNDSLALYPAGNVAPLYTSGGSVSLIAREGNLTLAPGSLIDVSGGGYLTATGQLEAGTGGSIALAASWQPDAPAAGPAPQLLLGATLRGYAISEGGSLSLTSSAICVAASDCSGADPGALWISPTALASGGFGSYALTADRGGLSVAPGTTIALQQQNLLPPTGFANLRNSPTLVGVAPLTLLPQIQRQPVNLSLAQSVPATAVNAGVAGGLTVLEVTPTTPSLSVGAGALIQGDPGASISLSSDVRLLVNGALLAPGGNISLNLALSGSLVEDSYDASQAIWLGPTGVLNVAGVPQIITGDTGLRSGQVLPGGAVTMTVGGSLPGSIELLPGSVIDVSGSSGVVDEMPLNASRAITERVASAGGSLSLTATNSIVLDSTVEAQAGVPGAGLPQPQGGSLTVALEPGGLIQGGAGTTPFPTTAPQIVVSQSVPPVVVLPGAEVPDAFADLATVSADAVQAAGFDSVTLRATPLVSSAGVALGNIVFSGNVSLTAAQQLTFDAATYTLTPGTRAQIAAPYVEFGNSSNFNYALPAATSGSSQLDVSGQFIELYGASALEGVGTASFASTGDLRLRGVVQLPQKGVDATAATGSLDAAGAIDLTAQQIYPSTLTQFTIASDPINGSITVHGGQGSNRDLLSAGGVLTLSAGTIAQDGVVRAPFGTINLDGNAVTLGSGSLTSTSANGLTIPFGVTQGGFDWVYALPGGATTVYGTSSDATALPPAQRVILQGAQVNVAKGATIDVSGGGDLQAYEWIEGVGGTNDVLSQLASVGGRPNQFAILPTLRANVAPWDPSISPDATLEPGDAVYLSGAPGLAAGTYLLLPSRYALLPGAFLVTPASSAYQDMQPGQSVPVLGGGTVVSGYETVAGTPFGSSRTSGFIVTPASVVLQQAQYTITSGNQFFGGQASTNSAPTPRLPEDSGTLELIASAGLALDGTLRAQPASGGLGAAVDISSAQIVVTGSTGSAAQPGQLVIPALSLDALGAQSLLLGGERADGVITTDAQSVTLAAGAALSAPELLLAATDQITIASGASLTGSGSAPQTRTYTLSGDGAFLSVSSGPQATVTRTGGTSGAGTLSLASGSSISANHGSVYLEGTENVTADGSIAASGGDLAVQSTRIGIGARAVVPAAETALAPTLFGKGGLRNVLLVSDSTVDFYGSVALNAQNLVIDAQGISGFGAAGDTATVGLTGSLTLTDSRLPAASGGVAVTTGAGAGSLTFNAGQITLGPGVTDVTGFDSVALNAQGALIGSGSGGLSTAGNLAISASRVTAAASASTSLSATGSVSIMDPTRAASLSAVTGLGGSLDVTGASIELGTQILTPSGRVTLTTTGSGPGANLVLLSGAGIDVAGLVRQYDSINVATPGGAVTLASAGNIELQQGSAIDVSAGAGGAGGALAISAPNGTVSASGALRGEGSAGAGATFSVDAQNFGDFNALNRALNAGGFSGGRAFRQRGAGDIVVAAGAANAVSAHTVSLEADQGGIEVDGLVDASGASGGSVLLAAAGNVTLNGTIDAHATADGQRGGLVQLETTGGSLLLNPGSIINVSGGAADASVAAGAGGSVLLRVPQATVADVLTAGTGVALEASIQGSAATTLEAFRVYDNSTGAISSTDVAADPSNPMYQDAATFMANAAAITQTLGRSNDASFVLEPGVEIDSSGDLALSTPWDLSTWRFGPNLNIPGVLTLRASGGVTIDSALSDGFASPTSYTLPTTPGSSWSYRIVAGADMTAANPLSVATGPTQPAASVTIAACTNAGAACAPAAGGRGVAGYSTNMVRTGTGFIDVSASGDFVLGNQASLLYTAGVSGPGIPLNARPNGLQGRAYPVDGGDISIVVDGDVIGAPTNQFVNAWLWRAGSTTPGAGSAVGWTVDFQSFQQGIGALGGGNVLVQAGGDVINLSASIPSIGRQVGGKTIGDSVVQVVGGGELTVEAGGSILGGSYYVGLGSMNLRAGNDVGGVVDGAGNVGLAPLLGLGASSASVTARGSVQLSGIVDPTLLPTGSRQGPIATYYSTYSPDASVSLMAVGGDVTLNNDYLALASAIGPSFSDPLLGVTNAEMLPDLNSVPVALDVLPPTLNIYATNGNINLGSILILSPAQQGNLRLFADQNINAQVTSGGPAQVIVSDADATLLPSVAAPQSSLTLYQDIEYSVGTSTPQLYAATPVHSPQEPDMQPAEIVARTGDVNLAATPGSTEISGFWSALPMHVVAGQDIVNLDLVAQNLGAADTTVISAGRDIVYPFVRDPSGDIEPTPAEIILNGPGQLQVSAGGNFNLGTSAGITTQGNLVNPNLPATGASVSVEAGVGAGGPQFAAFVSQYIDGSSTFDSEVVAFVQAITGEGSLSSQQAKQIFDGLSAQLQRTFIEQLFFDILRISGRHAADTGDGNFSQGFAAIQSLFPGANPNLAQGQTNPYTGDIDLYFSRIYTLQGGSISLLAPGGLINAGLAEAPTDFGIAKLASQLGIVAEQAGDVNAFAYSDFQVNQSRVFAADGGNILVWSTEGNIDAGRGAKTAISAPPPTITLDPKTGAPIVTFSAALTGSGIQTLATSPGVVPGDVDLFAPHGVVNANDAGIVAGNLTIAATAVLGTNNITVTGTSVGVPVVASGLGANVVGASSSAAGAMTSGETSSLAQKSEETQAPAAASALNWLDVFVLGFGEETCKADDAECLKREKSKR